MKILIAYDSKTGTARECAEMLAGHFKGHAADVFDLRQGIPALDRYDLAVIGGSVRMGKLPKAMSRFIKEEKDAIEKIAHAFFICCCISENAENYMRRGIPCELFESAVVADNFGGELRPERHRGLEKLFVALARKNIQGGNSVDYPNEFKTMPAILPDSISAFADKIKKSFAEKQ